MFTSKFVVGVTLVGLAVSGVAAAQPGATHSCIGGGRDIGAETRCDVAFTFTTSPDESRLQAVGDVVVEKRMSRQGLAIDIAAGDDAIQIAAAITGTVTITRGGQAVTVRPDSVLSEYDVKVRQLTAGSLAVAGLERMVLSLRDSERPEALSVLATFALLRALHGDDTGNTLLAQRSPKRRSLEFVKVGQRTRQGDTTVDGCWDEYERTVSRSYDRYSQCLRDYWWAQPVQYACGLEWALVSELALFRLISCSGGFPIG